MCYSECNALLPWNARMDADVPSIESSRSSMELPETSSGDRDQAGVSPGVYDIHSPRVPSVEEMTGLLQKALSCIPKELLLVNPDCGLKTRQREEAYPALENMVCAARNVRATIK